MAAIARGEVPHGIDPETWRKFVADLEKRFTPNTESQ
jgi:hypothetical protein